MQESQAHMSGGAAELTGAGRVRLTLNLLWFLTLVGGSFFIAVGVQVAIGMGQFVGPGLPEGFEFHLRAVAVALAVLVMAAAGLFRHRILKPVASDNEEEVPLARDADPRLRSAFAAVRAPLFIYISVLDLPIVFLVALGLMDTRPAYLWVAVAYAVLAALLFRPDFRALLDSALRLGEGRAVSR